VVTGDYNQAMRTAGIREFKARLSQYLREVQRGETVWVTDRGRVVAEIRPPGSAPAGVPAADRRVLDAVEQGLLRLPTAPVGADLWSGLEPLRLPRGTTQALLLEARAERE
jgi:antitoxin (DNA-binding transcriptional repressor) of toxin-antitoxin stability system